MAADKRSRAPRRARSDILPVGPWPGGRPGATPRGHMAGDAPALAVGAPACGTAELLFPQLELRLRLSRSGPSPGSGGIRLGESCRGGLAGWRPGWAPRRRSKSHAHGRAVPRTARYGKIRIAEFPYDWGTQSSDLPRIIATMRASICVVAMAAMAGAFAPVAPRIATPAVKPVTTTNALIGEGEFVPDMERSTATASTTIRNRGAGGSRGRGRGAGARGAPPMAPPRTTGENKRGREGTRER